MQAVSRPPNRLLQTLPAAEFQSLYPHLETVELAKGTILTEAGAPTPQVYLPHSGVVSIGQPFRRADGGGRHDRARQPHRRLRSPR